MPSGDSGSSGGGRTRIGCVGRRFVGRLAAAGRFGSGMINLAQSQSSATSIHPFGECCTLPMYFPPAHTQTVSRCRISAKFPLGVSRKKFGESRKKYVKYVSQPTILFRRRFFSHLICVSVTRRSDRTRHWAHRRRRVCDPVAAKTTGNAGALVCGGGQNVHVTMKQPTEEPQFLYSVSLRIAAFVEWFGFLSQCYVY